MASVRFLLARNPYAFDGGDAQVARLLIDAVAPHAEVALSVLWSEHLPHDPFTVTTLPPPDGDRKRTLIRSLRTHQSLLHARYCTPSLVEHLKGSSDDRYVACHTYMAAPYLQAKPEGGTQLCVNFDVSEAEVLRHSSMPPWVMGPEVRRTERDEFNCCRQARSTSTFDQFETASLQAAGIANVVQLRIAMPPVRRPLPAPPANLLYLGDRTWRPNRLGLDAALKLWPRIHSQVPDAKLLVVGNGPMPMGPIPDGVEMLGFVPSLDEVWESSRALFAPIPVGGGVRVKILEAAARGVPVVTTTAGAGSLSSYLGVVGHDDQEELISRCVDLLTDATQAGAAATELYETNAAWSTSGAFGTDVTTWLDL